MEASEASRGRGFRRVSGEAGGGDVEETDLGTVPEDEEVLVARRPPLRDGRSAIVGGGAQGSGVLSALLEHRCFLYTYSTLLLAFSLVALFFTVRHGGPRPLPNDATNPGGGDGGPQAPAPLTLRLEGYDFIVVGAGPAGSVMAKKLSEDPERTVLLIEAGGPTQRSLGGRDFVVPGLTMFDVPLVWSTVAHYTDFHWDVEDAMIAKGLGGCGIHNAMLYVRALERDFDAWNMTDAGWTWENALEIYKQLEDWDGPPVPWHGKGGPIKTSPPLYIDPLASYFLEACRVMGLPISDDFNAPNGRMGASYYHFNIRNGIRQSAATTFLAPVMATRANLDVLTFAEARRVIFVKGDAGGFTAKGVEVETAKGELLEARLKEPEKGSVVLTAGALGTPKILMNSGVGDSAVLQKAGIPLMNDLPGVGKNLQDHPVIPVTFRLSPDLAERVADAFGGGGFEELSNYADWVRSGGDLLPQRNGGGVGAAGGPPAASGAPPPMAHNFPPKPQTPYLVFASTSFTAGAFLKSDKGSKNPKLQEEYPDIQLTVFPRVTEPHLVAQKKQSQLVGNGTAGPSDDAGATAAAAAGAAPAAAGGAEDDDGKDMLVTVALLDPEARYTVELDGEDPVRGPVRLRERHFPESEGGGLLSVGDAAKLVWGLRQVRVIAKTFPLNQAAQEETAPGEDVMDEAKLTEWVRKNRYINSHWCGSARMGHADEPTAVVDGRLRVHNMAGLRVADASVFPTIPAGNTHSTVLLVASRGADLILEDFKKWKAN